MDSISEIIRVNKVERFASELQHTPNKERKNIIISILQGIQDVQLDAKTSSIDQFNNMSDKIGKMVLKKQWHRLQEFQKIDRIDDYVKRTYNENEHYEKIKKSIVDNFLSGKIDNKSIKYDETEGEIKEIPGISVSDGGDVTIEKHKVTKKIKKVKSDSESESSDEDIKQTKKQKTKKSEVKSEKSMKKVKK